MSKTGFFLNLLLFSFILSASLSFGQSAFKKGLKRFDKGEYQLAIQHFEKQAAKYELAEESYFYIGECYRLSNRLSSALPFYEKATKKEDIDEKAHYYFALALMRHEKYSEAKQVLEAYLEKAKDTAFKENAQKLLSNIEVLKINLSSKESKFRVKNMARINTPGSEYSPFYYKGFLYFTSNRHDSKIHQATGTPFTDIYKVKTKGAIIDEKTIEPLMQSFNDYGTHEACFSISPSGKTAIFARGNSGKRKSTKDVNLYISRRVKGVWTSPKLMKCNHPDSWNSTPVFSRNGNTIYFASNRPGGYGGTDLYSATRNSKGQFAKVRNMGPQINTFGNELFPFVSKKNRFFFASDGHPGFGGLDLFEAAGANNTIVVKNMNRPINSPSDDFGLFLYSQGKGFFCSNRAGGKGDDDIYTFLNTDPDKKTVKYYLKGITYENLDNEHLQVLPDTEVQLLSKIDNKVLGIVKSNKRGHFRFRIYEDEAYTLFSKKESYLTSRSDFDMHGRALRPEELVKQETTHEFEIDVILNKLELNKSIVLKNIYYDFDRWNIRKDAEQELDKLVALLNDNPKIRIELSSHTDSKGEDLYNMDLSQRRAESAVQYIISQGIEMGRLVAKGYGESLPIAENTLSDGSDNPEGRQKNRRTEFKVIELLKEETKPAEEKNSDLEERLFGE